jgi:CheY-like chemotaxis protein
VALLDFNMPEMDGLMLARELRKLPSQKHLIIALLSSGGVSDQQTDLAQGVIQGILRKPYKLSQLYDTLMLLLTGNRARRTRDAAPDKESPKLPYLRILLAEDNSVNQRVAQLILNKLGQRIDIVSDGLEVLAALRRQPYDVVLMDCEMPELDGFAASRAIRTEFPDDAQPYIIAMTANAMEGDRERCLAAGMDDYVTKPISKETVAAALRRSPACRAID